MGLIKIQLRLISLPLSGVSAIHTCITINHKNINFWGDLLVVLIKNLFPGCIACCRRIDMIDTLEKMANLNIPKDLSSDEANKYLKDACIKHEIKCSPPETTARLLDKVSLLCLVHLFL